jgi:hypothetical protein
MKMYGVGSPTTLQYSGMASPGTAPASTATDAEKQAFADSVAKYNVDKAAYDQYQQDYQNRLAGGNIYAQKQFGTQQSSYMPTLNAPVYTYGPAANVATGSTTGTGSTTAPTGTGTVMDGVDYTNFDWGKYYNPYNYADGGGVRTMARRYAVGGPYNAQDPSLEGPSIEDLNAAMSGMGLSAPLSSAAPAAPAAIPAPAAPAAIPAPAAPAAAAPTGLQALLSNYGLTGGSSYGADLAKAQGRATAETEAFSRMLEGAMKSPEDAASNKAEMFFRLAAAFGSPTKTGNFGESLALANKELGEQAKEKRAQALNRLQLQLKGQELKMGAAKEEAATLKTLAAEEMKDKRAIAQDMIKEYIASGKAQSTAGKQAEDEGLTKGTPEYQARVKEIADSNLEKTMAQVNATLAGMSTAQANLALSQEKFAHAQTLAEEKRKDLTPYEAKLLADADSQRTDVLNSQNDLLRAIDLNKKAYSSNLNEAAQYYAQSKLGSTDPRVVATAELQNLLQKAAFSTLKATFPGAISDSERQALLATVGLEAKSSTERHRILVNAFRALQNVERKSAERIKNVESRRYRTSSPNAEVNPESTETP